MNCETARDLVVDALIEAPDEVVVRELDAHLRACAACAEEAAHLRHLWEDMGRLPNPVPRLDAPVRFGRRLAPLRSSPWRTALRGAAAAALVAVGAVAGHFVPGERGVSRASAIVPDSEFVLLIRGEPRVPAGSEARLVTEYTQWARGLADQGRLTTAEKLVDTGGAWVGEPPRPSKDLARAPIGGFFVLRARNLQDAVALARGHPHVRYGGMIEVRAVDHPK